MAAVLVMIKAILEIALCALVAQFVVAAFAWQRRADNPIYRFFALIASPFTRLVRWLTPALVLDRHVPLATFFLLFVAWGAVLFELRDTCRGEPDQAACPVQWRGAP